MSNKQQTAVDWLIGEIELGLSHKGMKSAFHKAKELEKQQIMVAHKHGFTEGTCFGATTIYTFTSSEEYYNETFNK